MVSSRRFRASLLVCIASLFLTASVARGQVTTATLYGVVQDTSRAILPGVSVTVTHQGTSLTRETVTDSRGEFALPALPAGPYAIKIELSACPAFPRTPAFVIKSREARSQGELRHVEIKTLGMD